MRRRNFTKGIVALAIFWSLSARVQQVEHGDARSQDVSLTPVDQ